MKRSWMKLPAVALALACAGPVFAQSPRVATQGPCLFDSCLEFGRDSPADLTAQTFERISPVTGSAIVTFHGMLGCKSAYRNTSRLVSVQTQIVGLANPNPDGNDVGGHIITGLLWTNLPEGQAYNANTFNLASTRVFKVTEGQNLRVAFRLSRLAMSVDVTCSVQKSSAFTIHFVE